MLEEPINLTSLGKDITFERRRERVRLAHLENLYPFIEERRIPPDRSWGMRIRKYLESVLRFMRKIFRNRRRIRN